MRRSIAMLLALAALLWLAGPGLVAGAGARVASHGPRTVPEVALTFDDGVSPANCRRILAMLVARGVPATFFPIAEAMRADPAFWRLVVATGDPIGDHTMTHRPLPSLNEAAQFEEIDAARRLAESISGASMLRVLRPPYGEYNAATLSAASQAGFPTVLTWDTSDRDTSPTGALADMIKAAELAKDGSVILLHCGPNATPYVLGPLLDNLEARGLKPVTVPELLGLSWHASPAAKAPTPDQILAGLSPLPPTSSGGVVVGPSGIAGMTFPPFSPPASAAPSAVASPSTPAGQPSASATASLSATASPSIRASPSPMPTDVASAAPSFLPSDASGAIDDAVFAFGAGLLLAVVIVAIGVVRLATRRR